MGPGGVEKGLGTDRKRQVGQSRAEWLSIRAGWG